MEKLDEGLKTLLDLGKRRGFLTFDQVNDFLPDEASSDPDKIQSSAGDHRRAGHRTGQRGRGRVASAGSGEIDDDSAEEEERHVRRARKKMPN